jgi:uncharacterized protein YacL
MHNYNSRERKLFALFCYYTGVIHMNIEMIFRIAGLLILAALGVYWGIIIGQKEFLNLPPVAWAIILGIIGAVVGFFLAPFVTTRPARALRSFLARTSVQTILAGLVGLTAGLIVAALLAYPLSLLPDPFGNLLPIIGVILFGYMGVMAFVMRQNEIFGAFRSRSSSHPRQAGEEQPQEAGKDPTPPILLDTSVIIDGRIADIARTGFLPGNLLIPRFVLNELQYIADSPDNLRRQRGRRGMEVLSQLQKEPAITVRISDIDVEGVREVDDKLIILARQFHSPILTNDYNLNRIAELQGVRILNINELANAVKSVLLPGESLMVSVIQEGRETGQGVAYLDDGTMVVVEDGRDRINMQVTVTVTKILQTAAGRMIFARLEVNGK